MTAGVKRWDRWDAAALALLLAVSGVQYALLLRMTAPVGVFEDDGVYLVTSRALATTGQYVRDDLPGRPYQTKYPVLYPLLLSAVWRLWPEFPQNIPAMQAVNAVCAAGALWFAYRILRGMLGARAGLASAAMVLAAGTCFFWLSLIQFPMSEPLFALLVLAAVHTGAPRQLADERGAAEQARPVSAVMSGALAAAAYLTRSIGVAAIVAVVGTWLLRRRWREAALSAVVPVLATGGWSTWSACAGRHNAQDAEHAALRFDLDYGAWMPRDASSTARVAAFNAPALAWALAQYTLEPDPRWVERAARGDVSKGDLPMTGGAAIAIVAVLACLAVGLRTVRGPAATPVLLFLACYFGLVLIWPFRSDRFVAPVLPLVVPLMIVGAGRMCCYKATEGRSDGATEGRSDGGTERRRHEADGGARVRLGVCIILGLLLTAHGLLVSVWRLSPEAAQRLAGQREAAVELVRARTSHEAVIAGLSRGYFHLRTGRQFVPLMPYDDPYELYYPPDRRWWAGGRDVSAGQIDAHRRVFENRASDYFRTAGVRCVLLADDGGIEARLFARFAGQNASNLVVAGDAGPYRLWRVVGR